MKNTMIITELFDISNYMQRYRWAMDSQCSTDTRLIVLTDAFKTIDSFFSKETAEIYKIEAIEYLKKIDMSFKTISPTGFN